MNEQMKKRRISAVLVAILLCTVLSLSGFSQTCDKAEAKISKEALDVMYNAAAKGDLATIQILVEKKGVDVNQRLEYKQTALIMATYNGHAEVVCKKEQT